MNTRAANAPLAAGRHDHAACIAAALARAENTCRQRGLRLTPIRRRVLEMIWGSHRPSKAYDLLDAIGRERGRAAPPTVYRALDFLLQAGLVHKIESLNAYIGCDVEHPDGHPKFLICNNCNRVVEIRAPAVDRAIAREASHAGFCADQETIEIGGICQLCAPRDTN